MEEALELIMLDGSQEQLFEQLGFLVNRLGYELYDQNLNERDFQDIKDADDINVKDFVLFKSADGRLLCLGYSIGFDEVLFEKVVHLAGTLMSVPKGTVIAVTHVNLAEDRNTETFGREVTDLKNSREVIEKSFSNVTLVHATKEQLLDFLIQSRQELDEPEMTLMNTAELSGSVGEVGSIEDIQDGMALAGQVSTGQSSDRGLLFIGYHAKPEDLKKFVQETVNNVNMGSFEGFLISVTEHNYDVYMNDTIVKPF